jgi:hypothetical protein
VKRRCKLTHTIQLEGRTEARHVAVEPVDQRAGLGSGKERERHLLDVIEQLDPHGENQTAADDRGKPGLRQTKYAVDHIECGRDQSERCHQANIATHDAVVDEVAVEQRRDHADRGVQADQPQEQRKQARIRRGKMQDAPHRARFDPLLQHRRILAQGARGMSHAVDIAHGTPTDRAADGSDRMAASAVIGGGAQVSPTLSACASAALCAVGIERGTRRNCEEIARVDLSGSAESSFKREREVAVSRYVLIRWAVRSAEPPQAVVD